MKFRPPIHLLCIFLLAGLAASCSSLIGLRDQVEEMDASGGITIQVTPPPRGPAPTYALAWRVEDGTRLDSAGFQRLRGDGFASFYLKLDSLYRVGAFTDENGNGAYDAGEPLGLEMAVRPVPLNDPAAKGKVWKLELSREHGLAAGTVIQIPRENRELGGRTQLALGDVVSLDEKRFEPDTGGTGLWRPLNFLSGNSLGLYFTEPYDPRRIPVVFVYGIGGSPQDWRFFMDHFDRKRYQLWFFHYPSGMRLNRVSGALASGLRVLRDRYDFEKCYVVAHSMGGLVARTAITQAVADEGRNFIPRFVSISTPWGGHKAAESGVRHLKKPVPSWLDMTPDSEFLQRLHLTPLPSGTTHDLIYGSIDGGPFWMRERNDGVVTVQSETDPRILRKAASTTHFPRGHVEILQQQQTLETVGQLLQRGPIP